MTETSIGISFVMKLSIQQTSIKVIPKMGDAAQYSDDVYQIYYHKNRENGTYSLQYEGGSYLFPISYNLFSVKKSLFLKLHSYIKYTLLQLGDNLFQHDAIDPLDNNVSFISINQGISPCWSVFSNKICKRLLTHLLLICLNFLASIPQTLAFSLFYFFIKLLCFIK